MRLIYSTILALGFGLHLTAQQLPFFRNEIYAPQWYNPASFGTWNKFSVNGSAQHSTLFTDFNYGSGLISSEGFIGLRNSSGIGIGGTYLYDQDYMHRTHGITVKFNYQFAFDKMNLSVGVAPGFRTILQRADFMGSPNVYLPPAGIQTKATLDAGVYLYTDKFYIGASVVQMNRPLYNELDFQGVSHYFVNSGYRFKVSKNIQLFPSLIIGSDGAVSYFSTTFLVQFMKPAITFGFGYGIVQNFRGLLGYEFKGISFLYSIGTNRSHLTNGTYFHQEIRVSYSLKKKPKCSTCEYF